MSTSPDLRETALINTLRGCQLFAGLPLEDLRTIARITVLRRLAKGEYLFHAGEPSQGFFIVQSGRINVHRLSPTGKEQVIHLFGPRESFAEATLASLTGYPADARALEPTQVLLVRKQEFTALLRRQPELALRMLGSMSQHLRVLVGLLDDLTLKDVETRLAHWLVKHCPQPPTEAPHQFELPMTKRILAAELGTVSETLSRTLAKFREQGLLEVKGRRVTVCSPKRLAQLVRHSLGK